MEMADVLDNFNARVRRLLDIHLASGFQKYVLRLKYKSFFARPSEMFNEGKNLASYVSMNAMALKKILKKYDKVICIFLLMREIISALHSCF
jgi:E3 ubiquitin-protein ligase BAH